MLLVGEIALALIVAYIVLWLLALIGGKVVDAFFAWDDKRPISSASATTESTRQS